MKTCNDCRKEVDAKAIKCPYCRADLRTGFWRHPILYTLLIIIFSPMIIGGMFGAISSPSNSSNQPAPKTDLNASAYFTGTQFIISNKEAIDCVDAEIAVNGDYKLDHITLVKNDTYTVGAMQFAKEDGLKFNPWQMKVKDINIRCRGSNELRAAYWYGTYN